MQGHGTVEAPIYFSDSEPELDDNDNAMGQPSSQVSEVVTTDLGPDNGGLQPPETSGVAVEPDQGAPPRGRWDADNARYDNADLPPCHCVINALVLYLAVSY